jgi:hypothetical protein
MIREWTLVEIDAHGQRIISSDETTSAEFEMKLVSRGLPDPA